MYASVDSGESKLAYNSRGPHTKKCEEVVVVVGPSSTKSYAILMVGV